jgi:hypothetical protein
MLHLHECAEPAPAESATEPFILLLTLLLLRSLLLSLFILLMTTLLMSLLLSLFSLLLTQMLLLML